MRYIIRLETCKLKEVIAVRYLPAYLLAGPQDRLALESKTFECVRLAHCVLPERFFRISESKRFEPEKFFFFRKKPSEIQNLNETMCRQTVH